MTIDLVCQCESVFDHPAVLDYMKCLIDIFLDGLPCNLERCITMHMQHNVSTVDQFIWTGE